MKTYIKKGLAGIRIRKGYSINMLAEKTGLSASSICRMENGLGHGIRPANAIKICKALDAEFEDLFTVEKISPK